MSCSTQVLRMTCTRHMNFAIYSREEQDQLSNKLVALEKKIIVGGENLLEKAEEQERLLEESAKELETRKAKEEALRKALLEKEVPTGQCLVIYLDLGFSLNGVIY